MEEAAAMAMIHSQPHLSLHSYSDPEDDDDNDDGSSSSGELLRGRGTASSSGGRSSSSLRCRSYGDVAILPVAGGSAGGAPRPGNGRGGATNEHAADAHLHVRTTDERAAEAYFRFSAKPGYVSMEDVIGDAALYRDGSGRPLDAAITDPLVRTASRLYARGHRRRQQSPGPLGTRRGGALHGIVKKYVHPLQRFLVDIFCCIIPS